MTELSWDRVRSWRAARSHLDRRLPASRMLEVVADVGGLHAQVQSSAELQLWARCNSVRPDTLRTALWEERSAVRTWAMRGTLHVLRADDLPIYTAALSTHDRWWKGAWLRHVGLTEGELRWLLDDIRDRLGAEPVTREELASAVGGKARQRMLSGWGELLKPAAFRGDLCSGPPRGQNVTFVRPDRWLARWRDEDPAEAMKEVFRRFLHTYGPSTHQEFAAWWGIDPPKTRKLRDAMSAELQEVVIEGSRAWALSTDLAQIRRRMPVRGVRLLPHFDPYVMGFRPREALIDAEFRDLVFRKGAWVSPVLLVDGRIEGVWGYGRTRGGVVVTIDPFRRLSARLREGIADEAARLGRFLGSSVTVEYSA